MRIVVYAGELIADLHDSCQQAYDAAVNELDGRALAVADDEQALAAIAELDDRLERQRLADWAAYGEAVKKAVLAAATDVPGLTVPVEVVVDLETYRSGQRPEDEVYGLEQRLLEQALNRTPAPDVGNPLTRLEATLTTDAFTYHRRERHMFDDAKVMSAPSEPAPVAMALDELDVSIDRLRSTADRLVSRIEPVLRPEEKSPGEVDDSVRHGSAVTTRISHLRLRLDEVGAALARAADRVEL